MNFLENIFERLQGAAGRAVLAEAHAGGDRTATGSDLLSHIAVARVFLRASGLDKGDRCALVAANGIRWAALDLAIIAEGLIAVPMYARQAAGELAAMLRDAGPGLICCGDAALRDAISSEWPDAPRFVLFDEIFSAAAPSVTSALLPPISLSPQDTVAILYTSGTSGEAKGVMLTVGNLDHMLSCTKSRLDSLMGRRDVPDRVFHYLPFCFAGSWILLLSCLSRTSVLTMSMDLTKLADEIRAAAPDYFLNVPALLERIRTGVGDNIRKRGGAIARIFEHANAAWLRLDAKAPHAWDFFWLGLAGLLIFPSIRKRLGPNLRALICGSAPLARETQLFFMMLGIRVLQVYGLTETTAICTMDDPQRVEPGRVGPAIPGIEMKTRRERRNYRPRPKYFSGLLAPAGANSGGAARRVVSHRRSGRRGCEGKLAHHRPVEKSDYPEFRAQHCAGADRGRIVPRDSRRAARHARREWPQLPCSHHHGRGGVRGNRFAVGADQRVAASLSQNSQIPRCRRNCLRLKMACSRPTENCGATSSLRAFAAEIERMYAKQE